MTSANLVESINKALGQGRRVARFRSNDGKFRTIAHKGAIMAHYSIPKAVTAQVERFGGKVKPQANGGAVVAVFETHEKALEARTALMEKGYRVKQHDIPGVIFIDAGKGISESCSGSAAAPEQVGAGSGGHVVTARYGRNNGRDNKGHARVWHVRGTKSVEGAGHEGHFIVDHGAGKFAVIHRTAAGDHTLYHGDAHEAANVADLVCAAAARSAAAPNTPVHLGRRADGSHTVVSTLPHDFTHIQSFRGGKPLTASTECSPLSYLVKLSAHKHASSFAAENELTKHVPATATVEPAGKVNDESGQWHAFRVKGVDVKGMKDSLANAGVEHRVIGESTVTEAAWTPSKDSVFANRMESNRTPGVIDRALSSVVPGVKKFGAKVTHDHEQYQSTVTVPRKHAAEARMHLARALTAAGESESEVRQNGGHPEEGKVTFHVLHHLRTAFRGQPRLMGDAPVAKARKMGGRIASTVTGATLKLVNKLHAAASALSEDALPGGKGDKASIADFDPAEVEMGRKVEREHSDDPAIIDNVVCDHLSERPDYYTQLKKAGLADELKGDK